MTFKTNSKRWMFIASVAAGAFLLDPLVAHRLSAQTTDTELGVLVDRIEQVERDMQDMQRTLFQSDGAPAMTLDGEPVDATTARLIQRVDALEMEIRRLTNEVESIGFRLNQLTDQVAMNDGGDAPAPPGDMVPSDPVVLSGNDAAGTGPAPGEGTLGQVPTDSVPDIEEGDYRQQYNTALQLVQMQDFVRAEAALRRFVTEHGETDLAGPAMFWLGEVYYIQENYTQAAQTFLDSLRDYPQSPKAPDSMLKLGMSLVALEEKTQACATFRELPNRFPNAAPSVLQRARVESQRAGC